MTKKDNYGNIALLIDGDNAQASKMEMVIKEVSKYGTISIRRVYGDWSCANLKSWIDINAICHIEQINIKRDGENATDRGLMKDARKIIKDNKQISTICIVSSDGDFKKLVDDAHNAQLNTIVVGRKETAKKLKDASDVFISVNNLLVTTKKNNDSSVPKTLPTPSRTPHPMLTNRQRETMSLLDIFRYAYSKCANKDGWVTLSSFGSHIYQYDKTFHPMDHGGIWLSDLILNRPKWFETRQNDAYMEIRLKIQ